jgi:hypothetical protein
MLKFRKRTKVEPEAEVKPELTEEEKRKIWMPASYNTVIMELVKTDRYPIASEPFKSTGASKWSTAESPIKKARTFPARSPISKLKPELFGIGQTSGPTIGLHFDKKLFNEQVEYVKWAMHNPSLAKDSYKKSIALESMRFDSALFL